MTDFLQTSSIVKRLYGIAPLVVFLLLLEFLIMYFFTSKFLNGFVATYKTENIIQEISDIREIIESNIKTMKAMLLENADIVALEQALGARRSKIEELLSSLNTTIKDDKKLASMFSNLMAIRQQSIGYSKKMTDVLKKTNLSLSDQQLATIYALTAEELFNENLETLTGMAIILQTRLDAEFEALYETRYRPIYAVFLFALMGGLLFYGFSLRLSRHIKRSLQNLETLTNQVRQGLLTSQGAIIRHDEFGQLTHNFNQMVMSLRESHAMLEEKNSELEQFSYISSHDLQEPLRKITSFINILKIDLNDKLDDDSRENMDFVVSAASRMTQLIKDLLELSRTGRKELKLQKLDLNVVVKEALTFLDETILEKQAKIECGPLPVLDHVSFLIRQVFQNLIGNAIKFCPHDRTPYIRISAIEEPGQWLFCIQDNGIGIEKEYFDKIFEVFRRLHQREEYSGSGIGLTICKKIIERHGGRIWVESTVDSGSCFMFTLPTRQAFKFYSER